MAQCWMCVHGVVCNDKSEWWQTSLTDKSELRKGYWRSIKPFNTPFVTSDFDHFNLGAKGSSNHRVVRPNTLVYATSASQTQPRCRTLCRGMTLKNCCTTLCKGMTLVNRCMTLCRDMPLVTCGVQVSDHQIRLRGLTRRLMATVTGLVVE